MFFSLVRSAEEDVKKLEENLKKYILVPQDINGAKDKIQNFSHYIKQLGEQVDDKYKTPAPKSSIFFLSYYWHIQKPNYFSVFYPNSRNALENLINFNENQTKDLAPTVIGHWLHQRLPSESPQYRSCLYFCLQSQRLLAP